MDLSRLHQTGLLAILRAADPAPLPEGTAAQLVARRDYDGITVRVRAVLDAIGRARTV